MSVDPTRIDLELDPLTDGWRQVTVEGYPEAFDLPFMSHIEGNLWTGGCQHGLVLPDNIEHVVSLYPWEQWLWKREAPPKSFSLNWMFDSRDPDDMLPEDRIWAIARYAGACVDDGPTFVHCQAGINRSALIAALVLMMEGALAEEAIAKLRERRSPAVLSNTLFERWLLER